jgi:hypothetical protein
MTLDKNQIYIIDNFVNKEEQSKVLKKLCSTPLNTIWSNKEYNKCLLKINNPKYSKILPEKQFIINLGGQKTLFLETLENKLNVKIKEVLRSKINWIPREHIDNKTGYYPPHTDNELNHWVLLYYANTSDGDTLIFNETQKEIPFCEVYDQTLNIRYTIEHKQGRGVLFHGSIYHCGLPPIESDYRILFNHNFIIEE